MQRENVEHWRVLREQASKEEDSQKLLELVKEINRLLAERQAWLNT